TPKVEDTAKNAADKQVLKVVAPAAQTTPTNTNGSGSGSGGSNGGGSGGQKGGGRGPGGGGQQRGGGGGGPGGRRGRAGGRGGGDAASKPPFSKRLQVSCGSSCDTDFKVPDKKTLAVTDIVLGNPKNAKGTLTVRDNSTVLLVENLDNFRDLDFHFGTPISVP